MDDGSYVTKTYTFDDVVAALDSVAEYDWAGFLRTRTQAHEPPLDGLEAAGWELVYTDQPSEFEKQYGSQRQSSRHLYNFTWSIGLTVTDDGKINDVRWQGPAFRAGVGTGATLVAVNGHAYTRELLQDAIVAAHTDEAPIQLLVEYLDEYRTVPVDYHGGLKYPHLVRVEGKPDYLSEIIAARK